jgi:MFS family permease
VDRYGARRVLLGGATLVIIAGIAGMIPISVGWLTGVRVVLGLGTCAGFPAAMAVLRHHAEASGRGVPARVLSVLAMSAQTVMVIGPTLGGLLIGFFGWPAIFAVNIPLAGVSLVLALLWVPKDDRGARTATRIDVLGIALFSATLLALLFFLMNPGPRLWVLAVVAAAGTAFTLVELRRGDPFIDLRMLGANRPILRTYLRQALSFMAIYAIMFGYVQWLETARRLSEEAAGLMLLPMSGTAVCAAAFSGRATGIKARLVIVAVALIGGSALLLFVHDGTGVVALLALAALFGLAQGLTSVANQMTLYQEAPAEQMGTASGLFRTAQYLGAIIAATLIALCYGPHADSAGLHRLALALIAITGVLFVVTVADRGLRTAGARPPVAADDQRGGR